MALCWPRQPRDAGSSHDEDMVGTVEDNEKMALQLLGKLVKERDVA